MVNPTAENINIKIAKMSMDRNIIPKATPAIADALFLYFPGSVSISRKASIPRLIAMIANAIEKAIPRIGINITT